MIYLAAALAIGTLLGAATLSPLIAAAATVIAVPVLYGALPPITLSEPAFPILLLAALVTAAVVAIGVRHGRGERKGVRVGLPGIAAAGAVTVLLVMAAASSTILNAETYRTLIGEDLPEGDYAVETAPVDLEQMRTVPEVMARRLAEQRLGEDPALGSVTRLGEPRIQTIDGQSVWVLPLEHGGVLRWLGHREGTPGYVRVSATDARDVRLVQEIDGEPLRLRYNEGAWFGDSPRRRIYEAGHHGERVTALTFELDAEGRPHYVATRVRSEAGWGAARAVGTIVLDAQTGDVTLYSIEDTPDWVTRIQPTELVHRHLGYHGRYVQGWWNPSRRGMTRPTSGVVYVQGTDGRTHWYTGITSVSADEGTIGFTLTDTRTGATRLYRQPGATETAAQRSAEGTVQEREYVAAEVLMYNVSGVPTYLVPLLDRSNVVRLFAFVAVEDRTVVGTGDNLRTALRSYQRRYAALGDGGIDAALATLDELSGEVVRFAPEIDGGTTVYYLRIEGADDIVFAASAGLHPSLPLTRAGDRVEVRYASSPAGTIDLRAFRNLDVPVRTGPVEEVRVEAREAVRAGGGS